MNSTRNLNKNRKKSNGRLDLVLGSLLNSSYQTSIQNTQAQLTADSAVNIWKKPGYLSIRIKAFLVLKGELVGSSFR